MQKRHFSTVVVGVAFSPNIQANVFEALRMSKMFKASLVMVHVGEKTNKKEASLEKIISSFDGVAPIIACFGKRATLLQCCLALVATKMPTY